MAILATSGLNEYRELVLIPELYDPATGHWQEHPEASLPSDLQIDYPWMFVLPNEHLLDAGPAGSKILLRTGCPSACQFTWGATVPAPTWPPSHPRPGYHGSAVMYAPGKIMKCGGTDGNDQIVGSTWVVDLSSFNTSNPPGWLAASEMKIPRKNHNLVVLPDGKVLCVGGNSGEGFGGGPVMPTEIFDPQSGMWSEDASLASGFARPYHSTAVLLRDGRVVTGGGLTPAHATAQIYRPPYITSGVARPQIIGAPASMAYGEEYEVHYLINGGNKVDGACLIRLASVTHGFDHDQRRVPLEVIEGGPIANPLCYVKVLAPSGAGAAPPGYYMLFLTYEYAANQHVPCELAAYVQVGS